MKTKLNPTIRELRRILGLTQVEFAALTGASKDTVVSWETGRNPLSAGMARRIALVTGVDERSLLKPGGGLVARYSNPRRRYTAEEFERYRKSFWGENPAESARRQWRPCADTLELVFLAAAKAGGAGGPSRLPGVVDSFIRWCEETRAGFELGRAIEAELAERRGTLELTHSYRQWREMAREDPDMARMMGFKDDPKRGDGETLRLQRETVPVWLPGSSMRGGKR